MSSADSQNEQCLDGVCEVNFKPVKSPKRSFHNLKALATDLIEKVKDTLSGDNHDAVDIEASQRMGEKNHLAKMQNPTTRERVINNGNAQISMYNTDILERFVQSSGATATASAASPMKASYVRPRALEGQLKSGRYDNPWRYENRH